MFPSKHLEVMSGWKVLLFNVFWYLPLSKLGGVKKVILPSDFPGPYHCTAIRQWHCVLTVIPYFLAVATAIAVMPKQISRFLTIPLEIRQIVYSLVFDTPTCIAVEAEPWPAPAQDKEPKTTSWSAEDEYWAIRPYSLSSQLLRTCHQIRKEALPHLYSLRTFDLSAREALKLFLHNIGPQNFALIRHIVIDWDFLQDFGWALSKDEYKLATSGLELVEIKSLRQRHLWGTSIQWRNVKNNERWLCQAALDICQKHYRLKILAESYFRRVSVSAGMNLSNTSSSTTGGVPSIRSNCRVKWRFVTCLEDLREDETALDLQKDIDMLRASDKEGDDRDFTMSMVDPF